MMSYFLLLTAAVALPQMTQSEVCPAITFNHRVQQVNNNLYVVQFMPGNPNDQFAFVDVHVEHQGVQVNKPMSDQGGSFTAEFEVPSGVSLGNAMLSFTYCLQKFSPIDCDTQAFSVASSMETMAPPATGGNYGCQGQCLSQTDIQVLLQQQQQQQQTMINTLMAQMQQQQQLIQVMIQTQEQTQLSITNVQQQQQQMQTQIVQVVVQSQEQTQESITNVQQQQQQFNNQNIQMIQQNQEQTQIMFNGLGTQLQQMQQQQQECCNRPYPSEFQSSGFNMGSDYGSMGYSTGASIIGYSSAGGKHGKHGPSGKHGGPPGLGQGGPGLI